MAVTINRLITILALLCIALGVEAKKKQEYPHAEIKVSYNYHHLALRNDGEIITSDYDYLLLANSENSKYYNRTTVRDSVLTVVGFMM